jgi:hypothetical protein
LAKGLAALPSVQVTLSLSADAEILQTPDSPRCELPVRTYRGHFGFLGKLATAPLMTRSLIVRLAALRPDIAICAQPGLLDFVMVRALRQLEVPLVILVHEKDYRRSGASNSNDRRY